MAEKTDRLIRFLLPDAHARGTIIRGSHIISEAARIHGLHGVPAELFGKTLIASILLLSISKGGLRQVLQLDAHESQTHVPVRRMLAETRQRAVRGYINWEESHISMRMDDVGMAAWLGRPVRLSTVRDMGIGQPYVSTIEHDSDFLADHIVHYLNQSVQIQADVILHGNVGLMIEAMPGCDEEHWFKAVQAMAGIGDKTLESFSLKDILQAFDALGCKIVGHDDYTYYCGCSEEVMAAALKQIPEDDIHELADEHGKVTLSCQYCERSYEMKLPID
ncbi:MAG: Hsp33 family molecular chaperone HslO [Mariprofundaceae bacterium]